MLTQFEWISRVQEGIRAAGEPPAEPPPAPPPVPPTDDSAPAPEPAAGDPPPAPAGVKPDWRDARIAQLTARVHALQGQGKPGAAPPPAGGPSAEEIEREIETRANAKAATDLFNRACLDVAQAGRATWGDFDAKVGEILKLVDRNDPGQVATYNQFLQVAIETGRGQEIIYALGGNLNEAARVMALPPIKMAIELAKMAPAPAASGEGEPEPEPKPASKPSAAPRPVTPIRASSGAGNPIDPGDPERADQLSTAEWMRRRTETAPENLGGRRRQA